MWIKGNFMNYRSYSERTARRTRRARLSDKSENIKKSDILQLDTRRMIYELIFSSPGLHFREMARKLDIKTGVLEYQLDILDKQELIVKKKDGYYTRYFIRDKISPQEKNIISLLRLKIPRHIVLFLYFNKYSCNKEILNEIEIPPSTLSYYLRKLVRVDILIDEVRGRNTYYTIENPTLVLKILTAYKTSFFDEMTDRLTELWDRL
jgi:predicted transcriptional regulator